MAQPASHMWYVRAAERVWGPYPQARMEGFVREGRVTLATPVSPFAGGPFTPAAGHGEFAALLLAEAERQELFAAPALDAAPARPVPAPEPASAPEPARAAVLAPAPAAPDPRPVAPTDPIAGVGPSRALLVWGEMAGETLRTFPAALAALGPSAAVRPGLWLVRAGLGASAARNLLSRRLGPADSLLVVEADIEQAAWFNLEPGRDRALRRLWNGRA